LLGSRAQLNIANPQTGAQKKIEITDENKLRCFYDKRISAEVEGDELGDVRGRCAFFRALCARARGTTNRARWRAEASERGEDCVKKYYSYRVLTGSARVLPRIAGMERLHLQDHGW
jgi:hypothetical protein